MNNTELDITDQTNISNGQILQNRHKTNIIFLKNL